MCNVALPGEKSDCVSGPSVLMPAHPGPGSGPGQSCGSCVSGAGSSLGLKEKGHP